MDQVKSCLKEEYVSDAMSCHRKSLSRPKFNRPIRQCPV